MTTGKEHRRITGIGIPIGGEGDERHYSTACRCTIGADHQDPNLVYSEYDPAEDDDDNQEGEALSVYDAADIWRSSGEDEDYTSGYDEDELRRAAEE